MSQTQEKDWGSQFEFDETNLTFNKMEEGHEKKNKKNTCQDPNVTTSMEVHEIMDLEEELKMLTQQN